MIARSVWVAAAAVLALSACGEKAQELGGAVKQDTAAFQGTGVVKFSATDWKQGDKISWEQQLKTRTQNGQNDYNKVN